MEIVDVEQNSDAWKAIKAGKVSASRISDLLAGGKGLTRAAYMNDLLVERLTGEFTEGFESADTRRGKELEPQARAAYAFVRRVEIRQVGFVLHPRIAGAGSSPDGLIGDDGGLEIKCPKAANHLEYLDGGTLPKTYRDQIQFNISTTGRAWWDFASFHPAFPAGMDLHVRRIERDDRAIAEMETEIVRFLAELETKLAALRARYGQEAA